MLVIAMSLIAGLSAQAPRDEARQTLVVTTPTWESSRGRAVLVERGRVVMGPMEVYVGSRGLGWGLGENPRVANGPRKREGDRRSPAGVFEIGEVFRGKDSTGAHCVDDPASPEYARIVRLPPGASPRWKSAERMDQYRVAVVVRYNAARRRGAGSCIFLHDGARPTVGCTALRPSRLDALVVRLRPGARVVQLPERVYRTFARAWGLPSPALVLTQKRR